MCGIVGVISEAPVDPQTVVRMRDTLAHRGPDDAGLWSSADARVCLGHRRLAIVDLSAEANQPFLSADGRFVITFNGEIYNFQALRQQLAAKGIRFRTRSDTEVLVEAYRCWGERCLSRLSGMFAFAMWDASNRRLFCARDRAGEKPFYYAMVQGSFLFASELKGVVEWPGVRRHLHYPALIDYLTFGYVVDPKSIWDGCQKLPPGHWLAVELHPTGAVLAQPPVAYWDMRFQPDYSVTDWTPRILDTLQAAGKEMSFADVPVGTFLSGGVDSSSVTAALSKAGCTVKTFTVGFQEQEYDERRWAREVAQRYGTTHTERVVEPQDIAPVFERLLWHYDEPFNDYSYLPTFFVCREARNVITVALSGDGGDEVFAGYSKYRRLALRQDVERFVPSPLVRLAGRTASLAPLPGGFRQTLLQYGADAPAMLLDTLATGAPAGALRAAARGPLAEALKHYDPMDAVLPLLRQAPPKEVGLLNAMRYLDLKLTLAGDILVKVDRASMAVSLEVRPVYLHREILALAGRIPPGRLASRGQAKKALKSALRTWLPEALLHRRKMGFAMPLARWMGDGDLGSLFGAGRAGDSLEPVLDVPRLMRMTAPTAGGRGGAASVIHALFFLRHWLAQWTGAGPQAHILHVATGPVSGGRPLGQLTG